jgi:glutaconyl-CoA/methylmalonyl-CoA decarboxylase subunit gamma
VEVRLDRAGEALRVSVDLAAQTVTIAGRVHPFRVVASDGERVELEIEGERVIVEGWPAGLPRPLPSLAVNGERTELTLAGVEATAGPAAAPKAAGAPAPRAPSAPASAATGAGTAIVPPMPGKVLEVRVKDGDVVEAGQVLLVLEAMKMRNDVVAPRPGKVAELRVSPGTNVRAREPMLRLLDP